MAGPKANTTVIWVNEIEISIDANEYRLTRLDITQFRFLFVVTPMQDLLSQSALLMNSRPIQYPD